MNTFSNNGGSPTRAKRLTAGALALAVATLGYAVGIERRRWTLRTAVLTHDARAFTVRWAAEVELTLLRHPA